MGPSIDPILPISYPCAVVWKICIPYLVRIVPKLKSNKNSNFLSVQMVNYKPNLKEGCKLTSIPVRVLILAEQTKEQTMTWLLMYTVSQKKERLALPLKAVSMRN